MEWRFRQFTVYEPGLKEIVEKLEVKIFSNEIEKHINEPK